MEYCNATFIVIIIFLREIFFSSKKRANYFALQTKLRPYA